MKIFRQSLEICVNLKKISYLCACLQDHLLTKKLTARQLVNSLTC